VEVEDDYDIRLSTSMLWFDSGQQFPEICIIKYDENKLYMPLFYLRLIMILGSQNESQNENSRAKLREEASAKSPK
jgi:hypothetical protein